MSKDRIQLSDHFTTGRLLRFVASPIIMMIFTSVYCVVDGFFVSNFAGKTAFSALNLMTVLLDVLRRGVAHQGPPLDEPHPGDVGKEMALHVSPPKAHPAGMLRQCR